MTRDAFARALAIAERPSRTAAEAREMTALLMTLTASELRAVALVAMGAAQIEAARVRAAAMTAREVTEWTLGDAVLAAMQRRVPASYGGARINGTWRAYSARRAV